MLVPVELEKNEDPSTQIDDYSWRIEFPNAILIIKDNKKIHVIKWVRQVTGWGLRDAKKYVERHHDSRWGEFRLPVIDKPKKLKVVKEDDLFASCVETEEVIL